MKVKDLKLSESMVDAIKLARRAIGRDVMMPDGTAGTLKALVSRGIAERSEHVTILNATGMAVREALLHGVSTYEVSEDHPTRSDMITDTRDAWINRREAAIEADNARMAADDDDIPQAMPPGMTATVSAVDDGTDGVTVHGWHCASCNLHSGSNWTIRALMIEDADRHYCHRSASDEFETNELPGDAERIFDMENAALEGADIRAEYEAEVAEELRHLEVVDALISEIYADDRLMHLTSKGIFVSGNYVETMRRISGESRDGILAWRSRQYESRLTMVDDFHVLDMMVDEGTMPYGKADRFKRIIRATCRPHIGPKVKPSGKRRNRR